MDIKTLKKISDYQWEIPKTGEMLVPGRIFADKKLVKEMDEKVREQVINVACLPGILKASLVMPDGHWGYGFPIGGVAAMDPEKGVISVGGVGFDSGCGVRTLKTDLTLADVKPRIKELIDLLFQTVPCGIGSRGKIILSPKEADELFREGAKWVVKKGYGTEDDLKHIEDGGSLERAEPGYVSETAKRREKGQVGTLGSGNHYLEVQYIDEIYDEEAAKKFGLFKNQILVSIHCGSRALGHQIGTDYLKVLAEASRKYGIKIRDRELVCAPINSPEGKKYAAANLCALNYSYANRQVIAHLTRECFRKIFPKAEIKTFWDLTHNSARWERHEINGDFKRVLVHRKGSTRAFGPGREEVPEEYREVGQPVIIGGTMGTYSFILKGTDFGMKVAFGSACHGAGRSMSRTQAKKRWWGRELAEELERKGIYSRTASWAGFAEEAPGAYKDVAEVIEAVHNANLARKVVRMRPLGVIKG
jgi:tRNA-splicing ligase RtcB